MRGCHSVCSGNANEVAAAAATAACSAHFAIGSDQSKASRSNKSNIPASIVFLKCILKAWK